MPAIGLIGRTLGKAARNREHDFQMITMRENAREAGARGTVEGDVQATYMNAQVTAQ